jgi:hypothetical protein
MSHTVLSEATASDASVREDLAALGFTPELAAVITADEFRHETQRAWRSVLLELKGEKPAHNGSPLAPRMLGRAASSAAASNGSIAHSAATPELDTLDADDDERFPFYSAAQLNSGRFETRYLIRGVLAAAQPGGVFGAFKTLKTSLTADLLISLASGTAFLGHFAVPEPGRALFLSGESGLAALQSIARRICAARGLDLETLDNFELSPKLPNLDSPDDVKALGRIIRKKRPTCVAIDPAYLAIRGDDARNLFAWRPPRRNPKCARSRPAKTAGSGGPRSCSRGTANERCMPC